MIRNRTRVSNSRCRQVLRPATAGIWLLCCAFLSLSCRSSAPAPTPTTCSESPGALYERRIAPLLRTDRPSTCNECHAGGITLSAFARSTPCESMACLKQAGLVNLEDPESSVLLSWIQRAASATAAVSAELVQEEHDGFLEWIRHEANCRGCAEVECGTEAPAQCGDSIQGQGGDSTTGEPSVASWDEQTDPGDCDSATIDALFRGTVYEDRDRCFPCHFVEQPDAARDAPLFFSNTGGCQVAALASKNNILSRRLVDIEYPDSSLLLLKPLAESDGGLPHGGDDKFTLEGDAGYAAFRHWVRRYAACERAKR